MIQGDILVDDHMPFCKIWKEKNSRGTVASLEYPWTDRTIVDITEKTWSELRKSIIDYIPPWLKKAIIGR